ncbi:MAG: bifunctional adenosylcobinamide kinase/adenosylcobinamide-phosphate guanylyltransferase [Christensenella sp.]|uniref:bifunctional adenosylcobinamide kinase/adenosylcobinamide-phosphate guanylyltransferase n=1 Tax=Christensenella sp. TaxID=1935934 RepID=UPI002B2124E7|nr:bifunctional adenosylcobinamide kinase/adenosylcobinamide-phosphate guanylyltransferase [Christensenella sp.]MEA5004216.1 bifunctional adenosylcobinamide kinase/adenosylcobinamide-phosphate guanylyltransferase [Christensenella sp.]
MGRIIMLTGGARSGKSTYAQQFASGYKDVAYVATAVNTDEEMQGRIKRHKQERPSEWTTYEEAYDLTKVVGQGKHDVYLIDCLTVYITNLIWQEKNDWDEREVLSVREQKTLEETIEKKVQELLAVCAASAADFIIVTNEVGMGLVPENSLGRLFRDISGRANRMLAKQAYEAYFVVSGMLLLLKGGA